MIKEVVLNKCFGGFSLSWEAVERLKELGHPIVEDMEQNDDELYAIDIERDDPLLIQVVRELGEKAGGLSSKLKIQRYKIELSIEQYDGIEKAGYFCYEV